MIALWCCIGLMLIIACGFILQKPLQKMHYWLLIAIPAAALSLYWHWGHSQQWQAYLQMQQLPAQLPDSRTLIQQLQQHLAQDPDSAEGWYLLGRLYANEQQFADAAQAFAKANTIQPHQINTLINYAEALFMQQNPQDLARTQSLLHEALQIDPQNDVATNLLAISYYQQHAYTKAIQIWEALSEKYPADTSDGQALLKAIANAQKQLTAHKNKKEHTESDGKNDVSFSNWPAGK